MTGEQLIAAARSMIGAPFHFGSAGPHAYDCGGFLLAVARAAGLTEMPQPRYGRQDAPERLREALAALCTRVDCYWAYNEYETAVRCGWLEPGDVGLFQVKRQAQHLALFSGAGTLLHAVERRGVVEEPLGGWRTRLLSVWRFRGLE